MNKKLLSIFALCLVLFTACGNDDEKDPTISLSAASYQMTANGSVVVKLVVNNYSGSATEIPVSFSGSAKKGVDYTVSSESFKIGQGTSSEITFQTKDNYGEDKEIILKLGNLPNGITIEGHSTATIFLPPKDFIYYTFSANVYVMSQVAEPTIELRSGTTAYKAEQDIVVPIVIDLESSTAKEGEHFSFDGDKEIVIKKGESSGAVKLNWLKNEEGKNEILLKVGDILHPGVLPGLDNTAKVKVFGPIADQINGDWQGQLFVNYDWFKLNVDQAGMDDITLFPKISASDKLSINGDEIKANMTGALKNFFKDGTIEVLREDKLIYQEEGYPMKQRTVSTVKYSKPNVKFSAINSNLRDAIIYFRVFENSGVKTLEVTIADFEPTDFLANTYTMVKDWGTDPVMEYYPLRYYFTEVKK